MKCERKGCSVDIVTKPTGRKPKFCSNACRQEDYRTRHADLSWLEGQDNCGAASETGVEAFPTSTASNDELSASPEPSSVQDEAIPGAAPIESGGLPCPDTNDETWVELAVERYKQAEEDLQELRKSGLGI